MARPMPSFGIGATAMRGRSCGVGAVEGVEQAGGGFVEVARRAERLSSPATAPKPISHSSGAAPSPVEAERLGRGIVAGELARRLDPGCRGRQARAVGNSAVAAMIFEAYRPRAKQPDRAVLDRDDRRIPAPAPSARRRGSAGIRPPRLARTCPARVGLIGAAGIGRRRGEGAAGGGEQRLHRRMGRAAQGDRRRGRR